MARLTRANVPHPFPVNVTTSHVVPPASDDSEQFWVTESSDLRFPIGCWPVLLVVDGWPEGRELLHHKESRHDGQVHIYVGINHELHVLND